MCTWGVVEVEEVGVGGGGGAADLLLHPEPPDAVPDLLELLSSPCAPLRPLGHLDGAQVAHQALRLGGLDIHVLPPRLVGLHTRSQLRQVLGGG